MSRIGRLPIDMPTTVKASVKDGIITVEGPKGKLSQAVCANISVELEGNKVVVTRANEDKATKAAHGLMRQLVRNMIVGVSEGYKKVLTIIGVGFKAEMQGKALVLSLGYANDIEYVIPEGIKITLDGPTKMIIEGIDKQLVGQTAAELRSLRKPEPYKGKGIRYENEYVRAKSGKAGRA